MAKISTEFLKRRLQIVNDRLEVLGETGSTTSLQKERDALERAIDVREPVIEESEEPVRDTHEDEPVIDFDARFEEGM